MRAISAQALDDQAGTRIYTARSHGMSSSTVTRSMAMLHSQLLLAAVPMMLYHLVKILQQLASSSVCTTQRPLVCCSSLPTTTG